MSDKVSQCSKCGQLIIFMTQKPTRKNPSPKANPIERLPSDNGNILVNWSNLTYKIVPKDEIEKAKQLPNPPKLHLSHFATCLYSKQFRRKV
jgi:hypothetical protein